MAYFPLRHLDVPAVVEQINQFWAKTPAPMTVEAVRPGLRLEDILGPQSQHKWWRWYINPADHDDALKANAAHPGSYYEKTLSPGYQGAMSAACSKYLNQVIYRQSIYDVANFLTWQNYLVMFEYVTWKTRGDNFSVRDSGKPKQLESATKLAFDLRRIPELIYGIPLVSQGRSPTVGSYAYHLPNPDPPRFEMLAPSIVSQSNHRDVWGIIVNAVFLRFSTAATTARTHMQRLRSIARLIRTLQILQVFEDGNDRLNIFMLLPMLLLSQGFGLPLGGAYRKQFKKGILDQIFNGGFTIEEIAKFLWLAQDMGVKASRDDTVLYDSDPAFDQ